MRAQELQMVAIERRLHDMLAVLFWHEAAQTLQQIMEHNPKRARPTKRKLRPAADGPKEVASERVHVKKEKPDTSKRSTKAEDVELWQIIDSDAESDCVCEMAEATFHGHKVRKMEPCGYVYMFAIMYFMNMLFARMQINRMPSVRWQR